VVTVTSFDTTVVLHCFLKGIKPPRAWRIYDRFVQENNSEIAFIQQKCEKKLRSVTKSTFVIAICVRRDVHSNLPEVGDICSVAIAVQNMHLVATEYNVGAYWSSGSIYDGAHKKDRCIVNPAELREFLQLPTLESSCIGRFLF
jgi:hypothetical protein